MLTDILFCCIFSLLNATVGLMMTTFQLLFWEFQNFPNSAIVGLLDHMIKGIVQSQDGNKYKTRSSEIIKSISAHSIGLPLSRVSQSKPWH